MEVVIDYLHQDIDCPIITGQLYNGEDLPPFSAGQDSAANHPGVLKGMHTQGLNNPNQYNQWQSDATPNQLRTRSLSSTANSELDLGYLIDQPPTTSTRGAYRGQGAELRTDGWLVARMGAGLLISSSARPDQTHSAQGSQMDVQEATSQLKGGQDLQQRLTDAAQQAQAITAGPQSIKHSIETMDVTQQGQYEGAMNGQPTTTPGGSDGNARFSGGDPIPKFAEPHLVLDSPDDRLNATPSSLMQYAAGNLTQLTQQHRHDIHQYTHSQISGQAASIFAQQGGLQFIVANGPVSLQAHSGALSALSKEALTVTSSNDEIEIKAPNQITLIAGDTKIDLNGANVTLSTSGELNLKGTLKQVAKGLSGGTTLPTLPQGVAAVLATNGIPTMAKKEVTKLYWSYGPQFNALQSASRHYVDMNLHACTTNYSPGESVTVTLQYSDDPTNDQMRTHVVAAQVGEGGEAIFKALFKSGTLNLNWRSLSNDSKRADGPRTCRSRIRCSNCSSTFVV